MPMEVNKRGVILTIIILASICYILYSNGDEISADVSNVGEDVNDLLLNHPELKGIEADDEYDDIGVDVEYVEDYVNVNGIRVFYMYCIGTQKDHHPEPAFPILLLHGAAFQAQTWKTIGTLQFLAKIGFFPIAIDLPGFGNTKSKKLTTNQVQFMEKLTQALHDTIKPMPKEKLVIISPSMSGLFSLPYVFKHMSGVKAYIPIAPVNKFTVNDFKKLTVPTLIIYGELDEIGKITSQTIHNAPNSRLVEISNANHPAYKDSPDTFNHEIEKFLIELEQNKQKPE